MSEKEAGQVLGKKIRDAIIAAQRGEITGAKRNEIMQQARDEYVARAKGGTL